MHFQTFWYGTTSVQPTCQVHIFITQISTEFIIQQKLRFFECIYNLMRLQSNFTIDDKIMIFFITPSTIIPVEIGHQYSYPLIYPEGVLQQLFQDALYFSAQPPYMATYVSTSQATWEERSTPCPIVDPQFAVGELFRVMVH